MPIEYYNVAKLPTDVILFEIFSRLPAKSLIRLRCVCKSWSSLIRHPFFVRTHQKLQTQSSHNHHLLWHPNLAEPEREQICQSLTCKNLTSEVGIQAAKNRVLSLRTIDELFYLKNQELKDEVEEHKNRISDLESANMKMNEVIENLKKEVEKLGSGHSKRSNKWTTMSKKLGFSKKPLQLGCRTSQDAVHNPNPRRKDNVSSTGKYRLLL
ncbi:BTB/POZ domain-containing protein At1g30440-like [Rosa chinensis]|uniref:BTB/POZ domain-containing protein At1g30440-like n=1 Tax=Rosa chinensis TaxID=74649 RepID=UPI001AD90EB0|nr:BTB/POZ domain-containing protein At1g30440-like [Rosa chinensis]